MLKRVATAVLERLGLRITRADPPAHRVIPEISAEQRAAIAASAPYSMTALLRQWALVRAVEQAHARGLEGEIVECGVWKGGNLVLAALTARRVGWDAVIRGYDTFTGMTEPTAQDRNADTGRAAIHTFRRKRAGDHVDWCYAPVDEVRAILAREAPGADVRLVQGPVEETLRDRANLPERIAVLRLDTDWYESTKVELEVLFPRLVPGGVLLIDDYGEWAGARAAVDEYFAGRNAWFHYLDRTGRLLIKD